MKVPLAAHRVIAGGQQLLDVWVDGRRERVAPPFLPYCYAKRPLPGALSSVREDVRPLSTLRPEPWVRCTFPNVLGVRDASRWAAPGTTADDHVAFVERVLIDEPDWFRRFPHTRPLRVLTFDIEQATSGARFPTARDPLLSIAWALDDQEPACALAAPGPDGTPGPDADILRTFLDAVRRLDPDLVVGYNLRRYDLPMLLARCAALGVDASSLARSGQAPALQDATHLDGRVVYDVFDSVRMDQTLYGIKDLKLKTVGSWMGFPVRREDPGSLARLAGSERLATYNMADVDLTRRLHRVYFRNFEALAEVYGAPLNLVVRATSSFHTTVLQGRVLARSRPRIVSDGRNDERYPRIYDVGPDGRPFEAAIVDIYRRGLFRPVWKLDFSSMFPSVMVSLGAGSDNTRLAGTAPLGAFRFEEPRPGLRRYHIPDRNRGWNVVVEVEGRSAMAEEVRSLIRHRLALKGEAKRAGGVDREGLHARQGALKIILNSIYGVNASRHSRYGSLPVALAIVGVARQLIRWVEARLGEAKIETDTDGVFSSEPVDAAALERGLEDFVEAELGAESHLQLEAEDYAAGYFKEAKTYLLLHHDGRLEKHGVGFKGSSHCGVFDRSVDAVARALLQGDEDPARVLRACLDLDGYAPEDFVMRVRIGKEDYKAPNALGAQVARAHRRITGELPAVGEQLEYVKTTRGYDAPTEAAFRALDRRYYRAMVRGIGEKLSVQDGPVQRRLGEF